MTPRTGIALLLAGAVVLAGGWYLGPAQTQPAAQAIQPGSLMFPNLAARLQDAAEVDVAHQGKTLVIRRKDGVWGMADRGGYPVQAEKLRAMLTALTELRLVEPRTNDPADYNRLGVGDPNAPNSTADLLRVLDASGKPIVALIVGHRRVLTEGDVPDEVFVRRPDEAQSWLAEGSLEVDADPQQWILRDIMNIDRTRIAHVSVQRAGTTLDFDGAKGKLTMAAPASHPALDNFKLDELAGGLESLTCEDVVPGPAPAQGEIGQSVFTTTDGLAVNARLYQSGKDVLARFDVAGNTPEAKQLNARVGGWTYQLGNWKEAALVPALTDLAKPEEKSVPLSRSDPVNDREYPARPIVGIGVVVLKGDSVLLVRRGKPPNMGSWTLPGGAQELAETTEQAARRELAEETGVRVGELHLVATVDNIRRDPTGRVQFHYTIIDYAAAWLDGEPVADTDVSEAVWAPLDRLADYALWSEAHRVIALARHLVASGLRSLS